MQELKIGSPEKSLLSAQVDLSKFDQFLFQSGYGRGKKATGCYE